MLYGRRNRLRKLAEDEAVGNSFWTDELDEQARYKLLYAVRALIKDTGGPYASFDLLVSARQHVLESDGIPSLAGDSNTTDDVARCIMNEDADRVYSLLESLLKRAVFATGHYFGGIDITDLAKWKQRLPAFRSKVETVLREHRVKTDLVDDQFVDFESREMHESVVSPVLTLLGGRADLDSVEKAYADALAEIHDGKPEDAITDAGTALQEMLTLLGCSGNSLGPLIDDAKNRRMLGPHDSKLTTAIKNAMDWVSADRSNMGDGHSATSAEREDAWLIVHIVGALILRLASDTPRTA